MNSLVLLGPIFGIYSVEVRLLALEVLLNSISALLAVVSNSIMVLKMAIIFRINHPFSCSTAVYKVGTQNLLLSKCFNVTCTKGH